MAGVNAAYTYNGDGLRVGQTLNGQGTTFTWDMAAALPQVLATSDGAAYVLGLSLLAQQQSGAPALSGVEGWQYPLPDGLGSLRQWTDVGGQVTYAARYAPFGSLLWQQRTAPAPWGFAGEMQNPTGLLYLRARWYDPATGGGIAVSKAIDLLYRAEHWFRPEKQPGWDRVIGPGGSYADRLARAGEVITRITTQTRPILEKVTAEGTFRVYQATINNVTLEIRVFERVGQIPHVSTVLFK